MSKTLISGGYAPSISVSEFSGFSTSRLDEPLPTIFIAYLDSLSNLLNTWFVIQFSRYMVGLSRLELPTSRLSGVRSNLLSYRPKTL